MNPSEGEIDGVQYFSGSPSLDERGSFIKVFSSDWPQAKSFQNSEVYYSDSHPGVLRGMHLQVGEASNERLITILSGKIFDVLLDLRPLSPTFLNFQQRILTPHDNFSVYVPEGIAHGFQAIEESRTMYISSKAHDAINDLGIDSLSFGINWPVNISTRSKRDLALPSLSSWLSGNH